jgi:hypothetical protein
VIEKFCTYTRWYCAHLHKFYYYLLFQFHVILDLGKWTNMKLSLHLSAIYLSDCCYLFTGIAMNHSLRPLELYGKCLLHAVVFEISHSSMERNTSNDLMSLFQVDSGCRHPMEALLCGKCLCIRLSE